LSKTNIHEPLDPLNTVMKEGEDGFFESRDETGQLAHDELSETAEELVLSMSYGPYAEFCSRFVLP
jgi:hypothetical protein